MHPSDSLITTIVSGIVLAFTLGFAANKIRLSPLIGYLIAGVLVSPFTPGFVADQDLSQIAELGVILLMFGVGLHFSFEDLLSVKRIAIPGALIQMTVATILGYGLGVHWGLPLLEAVILGFSLSVASTVVLLRALEERSEINTQRGHIAVGWLIVEDIFIIVALVLLPVLTNNWQSADLYNISLKVCSTLFKVCVFVAVMLVAGKRFLPWLLYHTARLKSQEMFSLGIIAIALGVAYAAYRLFDASFALGAFFAGLVLNKTDFHHKAMEHLLPLRDIFSVLFFVSVGMLFDPMILIDEPLAILSVLFIIIVGKSLAALIITTLTRCSFETGIIIAASLSQIGEFSFVLAGLGMKLGLLSGDTHKLIIAAALLSITLNPALFRLADHLIRR